MKCKESIDSSVHWTDEALSESGFSGFKDLQDRSRET